MRTTLLAFALTASFAAAQTAAGFFDDSIVREIRLHIPPGGVIVVYATGLEPVGLPHPPAFSRPRFFPEPPGTRA